MIVTIQKTRFRIFGRELFAITHIRRKLVKVASPAQGELRPAIEGEAQPTIFVVNSLFLADCFRRLTATPDEHLHAVTGTQIGHFRTLDRIVPFRLSRHNTIGAVADDDSLADTLIRLNAYGLRPWGLMHSHPGCGVAATLPSNTDRRTQDALEAGGAEIVGAIVSRDAVFRFYSNRTEPQVRVFGNRIKEIQHNVFQLQIENEDLPGIRDTDDAA